MNSKDCLKKYSIRDIKIYQDNLYILAGGGTHFVVARYNFQSSTWVCEKTSFSSLPVMGYSPDSDNILLICGEIAEDATCKDIYFSKKEVSYSLSEEIIQSPTASKVINNKLFFVGLGRDVIYKNMNNWVNFSNERMLRTAKISSGFDAVDGFSDNDIYAVGGKGEVWHFIGNNWNIIDVPTNKSLFDVCCASDGFVYITGLDFLLKGRNDSWEVFSTRDDTGYNRYVSKHIAWYEGCLYLSAAIGEGLFKFENGQFSIVEYAEGDRPTKITNVVASNNYLVVSGDSSIAVYKGKGQWSNIYGGMTVEEYNSAVLMMKPIQMMEEVIEDTYKIISEIQKLPKK